MNKRRRRQAKSKSDFTTTLKWIGLGVGGLLALLLIQRVLAAAPLPVQLDDTIAFRHLLEDHDFLVLSRYRLQPSEETATDTFTSVTVDAGDDADPMVLTNRHNRTDTTSMTVQEDSGPTDITSTCTLGADRVTVTCINTGLGAGTFNFTITYLNGWDSYSGSDVIYRLLDQTSTLVAERTVPSTGFALVGLYLDATTPVSTFTGDDSTTDFTLTTRHFYSDETGLTVTVDGAIQTAPTNYSFDSANNQVDFVSAPAGGAAISVTYVFTGGIIWNDSSVSISLSASPSLWSVPSSQSTAPEWRSTETQAATDSQLQTDLRAMLRSIEVSDPTVDGGDYVTPTGISDAGQVVAQNAFSRIREAVPLAFSTTRFNPFSDHKTQSSSYADQVDADAAAESIGQTIGGFGGELTGITSGTTGGGLLFLAIALFAAVFTIANTKPPAVGLAVLFAWLVIVMGWLLGGVPNAWAGITGALLAGYGLLWLVMTKVFARA